MSQALLKAAREGNTVLIPAIVILEYFVAEDELQSWCNAFGLQFVYLSTKKVYKIYKAT